MDSYEATKVVFQRIQNLDPENASKIMGVLLIQDHGEKEMIRLAFGPEALLHSVILKARKELGVSSNTPSTPSTPSSPSPFSNPLSLSRQNSCSSGSSRLLGGITLPSPLSIPNLSSSSPSSWTASSFSDHFQNTEDLVSPSSSTPYVAAATNNGISSNLTVGSSSSSMNSSATPFYGSGEADLIDEFHLQDQLSFLNDGSPTLGPKKSDLYYPPPDLSPSPTGNDAMHFSYAGGVNWGGSSNGGLLHRRSCSVSDICGDDSTGGFGWKPCLYFARGFCKNGASCRFVHGGLGEAGMVVGSDGAPLQVGSPNKFEMIDQCQELMRSKSAQQQRMAAASQLMASASSFPNYSPAAANKCVNFILQQQQLQAEHSPRAAAAALMMGEDMYKYGRSRLERNDFNLINNPGSRQIYLTFPADSTFREEDVSNYFSIYGPVQDVRIPYQQKRMFGFVTFVYPETVKLILAKGNPHFVCDARVLVKPYKEKGKVPEKFRKQQQQQQMESCDSPTSLDARDPYDLHLGARMLYNTQDMWRRKLEEQVDLQNAIELQSRRLTGLQLLDVKRHSHYRALSTGAAISSPMHSPNVFNHCVFTPSNRSSPEVVEENGSNPAMEPLANITSDQHMQQSANVGYKERHFPNLGHENGNGKESPREEESDLPESLEHNLPDSPFASPKAVEDYMTAFFNGACDADKNTSGVSAADSTLTTSPLLPATATLDMASFASCYFQAPRFASGHGAIGM